MERSTETQITALKGLTTNTHYSQSVLYLTVGFLFCLTSYKIRCALDSGDYRWLKWLFKLFCCSAEYLLKQLLFCMVTLTWQRPSLQFTSRHSFSINPFLRAQTFAETQESFQGNTNQSDQQSCSGCRLRLGFVPAILSQDIVTAAHNCSKKKNV